LLHGDGFCPKNLACLVPINPHFGGGFGYRFESFGISPDGKDRLPFKVANPVESISYGRVGVGQVDERDLPVGSLANRARVLAGKAVEFRSSPV